MGFANFLLKNKGVRAFSGGLRKDESFLNPAADWLPNGSILLVYRTAHAPQADVPEVYIQTKVLTEDELVIPSSLALIFHHRDPKKSSQYVLQPLEAGVADANPQPHRVARNRVLSLMTWCHNHAGLAEGGDRHNNGMLTITRMTDAHADQVNNAAYQNRDRRYLMIFKELKSSTFSKISQNSHFDLIADLIRTGEITFMELADTYPYLPVAQEATLGYLIKAWMKFHFPKTSKEVQKKMRTKSRSRKLKSYRGKKTMTCKSRTFRASDGILSKSFSRSFSRGSKGSGKGSRRSLSSNRTARRSVNFSLKSNKTGRIRRRRDQKQSRLYR